MRDSRTDLQPNVHIELDENIPAYAEGYARAEITDLVRVAPKPILFIKVRLSSSSRHRHPDVTASATVDVNGIPLISHSVGSTPCEAIDLLQGQLRGQLSRM
jgi:hypothetical protein